MTMTAREKQFSQTVTEQKSTIYTVCYMFSQDADEVSDLFPCIVEIFAAGAYVGFKSLVDSIK